MGRGQRGSGAHAARPQRLGAQRGLQCHQCARERGGRQERAAVGRGHGRLARRPRSKATLEGHADKVLTLAFDAAGRVLASGAWDGEVRLWGVDVAALNIVSSLPELGNQSQIKNIVVIILTKSVIVKS